MQSHQNNACQLHWYDHTFTQKQRTPTSLERSYNHTETTHTNLTGTIIQSHWNNACQPHWYDHTITLKQCMPTSLEQSYNHTETMHANLTGTTIQSHWNNARQPQWYNYVITQKRSVPTSLVQLCNQRMPTSLEQSYNHTETMHDNLTGTTIQSHWNNACQPHWYNHTITLK